MMYPLVVRTLSGHSLDESINSNPSNTRKIVVGKSELNFLYLLLLFRAFFSTTTPLASSNSLSVASAPLASTKWKRCHA